ncbi:MAG: hypothetical protein QGH15_19335 [Kiritimatiellia bacterium]|nr:hypothetical protein [Kiritimatiellia bacterium]
MPWKRMLALVTGQVDESLLHKLEYVYTIGKDLPNDVGDQKHDVVVFVFLALIFFHCVSDISALSKFNG